MIRMILSLLCLICIQSCSKGFVAEEGKYQNNFAKEYFVDLNKDQLKCVNDVLQKSADYDPTDGGRRKVDLPIPTRLLILKSKNNKEFQIMICTKGVIGIEYLFLTIPEKEKEKLDQLVRTLEKELQAKEKKKVK